MPVKLTVQANEDSDLAAVVCDLQDQARSEGLTPDAVAEIAKCATEVLSPLIVRGQELARAGSQMTVTRNFDVAGCTVSIAFGAGLPKPTLLARLLMSLRR